ncbi:hypothetical protein [Lactiplantibacillus pentosus]
MNNDELSKLLNDYFEAYQNTTKIMMDLVAWPLSQNKLSFEQFLILRRIATTEDVTAQRYCHSAASDAQCDFTAS